MLRANESLRLFASRLEELWGWCGSQTPTVCALHIQEVRGDLAIFEDHFEVEDIAPTRAHMRRYPTKIHRVLIVLGSKIGNALHVLPIPSVITVFGARTTKNQRNSWSNS